MFAIVYLVDSPQDAAPGRAALRALLGSYKDAIRREAGATSVRVVVDDGDVQALKGARPAGWELAEYRRQDDASPHVPAPARRGRADIVLSARGLVVT